MRLSFNPSGPCLPGKHYMLPPERRLGRVLELIEARLAEVAVDELEVDEHERRALDAAIETSLRQAANGEVNPASRVLARLRARRRG